MIISEEGVHKFKIRNLKDLKIIKTVEHDYGFLHCGLCYPERKIVVLGISDFLVEFNYESMEITNSFLTMNEVSHIQEGNNETFLVGELKGDLELIESRSLTCLSYLKI